MCSVSNDEQPFGTVAIYGYPAFARVDDGVASIDDIAWYSRTFAVVSTPSSGLRSSMTSLGVRASQKTTRFETRSRRLATVQSPGAGRTSQGPPARWASSAIVSRLTKRWCTSLGAWRRLARRRTHSAFVLVSDERQKFAIRESHGWERRRPSRWSFLGAWYHRLSSRGPSHDASARIAPRDYLRANLPKGLPQTERFGDSGYVGRQLQHRARDRIWHAPRPAARTAAVRGRPRDRRGRNG
jgi:hypothetical protein